jgi:hypothetical protein
MHFSEDDLRFALRRKDPGAGFTQRLMARINQAETNSFASSKIETRYSPLWLPLKLRAALTPVLIAGLAMAGWLGIAQYQQLQKRRSGELARRETMLALRITTAKLNHVFDRVRASRKAKSGESSYENNP